MALVFVCILIIDVDAHGEEKIVQHFLLFSSGNLVFLQTSKSTYTSKPFLLIFKLNIEVVFFVQLKKLLCTLLPLDVCTFSLLVWFGFTRELLCPSSLTSFISFILLFFSFTSSLFHPPPQNSSSTFHLAQLLLFPLFPLPTIILQEWFLLQLPHSR